MKAHPVIVNFIPQDGTLEIWTGNECLTVEGFLKGHSMTNSTKVLHSKVLDEYAQKKLIKKLVNNLPE